MTRRREFLTDLGFGAAALALPGCRLFPSSDGHVQAKIALQLYSLNGYIAKKKTADGKVDLPRLLDDVAAVGYKGVEFYDGKCYGYSAAEVRRALDGAGLRACGFLDSTKKAFGLDTHARTYDPEVLKRVCDFNRGFGNDLIVCTGGGNIPPGCSWDMGRGGPPCKPSAEIDEHVKRLTASYNRIAADAARFGCRVGIHNHAWEHAVFLRDGTSFWDYFFTNTDPSVCMEQDVGWSTCAGVDPKEQYRKYPHRSPTLHAKENGMGKDVTAFDAILGEPGRPGATPVDWDGLLPVTEADGVKWYIVECERHFDDFSAVRPSYEFLRKKFNA